MADGGDGLEDLVARIVADRFAALGLPGSPAPEEDLREAGLTSLALVDLIFLVEDGCGVEIPDAEVNPGNFATVRSIAGMVARLRTRSAA